MKSSIVKAGILFAIFGVIVFFASLHSCKKESSPTVTGANQVVIQNMAFSPQSMSVALNTTVTWTNKDMIAHTVTSDSGVFSSGNVNPGSTFSYQFTKAGNYPYHCTIHPYMTGMVMVEAKVVQ